MNNELINFKWPEGVPKYFVMYWGEIVYGTPIYNSTNDQFYIVPNENLPRAQKVNTYVEFEKLAGLGFLVKDSDVVVKVFPDGAEIGSKSRETIRRVELRQGPRIRQDVKQLYIFGAGASSFCRISREKDGKDPFFEDTLRPPLGVDLFHERFNSLITNYPGIRSIVSDFELRGSDIEAIMQQDWNLISSGFDVETMSEHIQVQFYLAELFKKISNHVTSTYFNQNLYRAFARDLRTVLRAKRKQEQQIGIITFNYDLLLDSAIQDCLQIEFNEIDDYINFIQNKGLFFFKPHGSCNWSWPFTSEELSIDHSMAASTKVWQSKLTLSDIFFEHMDLDEMADFSSDIYTSNLKPNHIRTFKPNKDKIRVNLNGGFPAIHLPYRTKDDFIMPKEHVQKMIFSLQKVEELIIIGWKGNEELFNLLLKKEAKSLKKITIADPNAQEVLDNLDLGHLELDEPVFYNSFEEFVRNQRVKNA